MTRGAIVWLVGFVVLLAVLNVGLFYARGRVIDTLGTPAAIADWQKWKAETKRVAESDGPVKRREAKANEPPVLLMFRDHFPAVVVSLSISAGLLYFFVMIVIRGMLGPRRQMPLGE